MIGIATTTANANGALIVREIDNVGRYENRSRVSSVKTLDGGVVVVHSGVADGDRIIRIKTQLAEADETTLRTIFETETLTTISLRDGCFLGVIAYLRAISGEVEFGVIIKERISA